MKAMKLGIEILICHVGACVAGGIAGAVLGGSPVVAWAVYFGLVGLALNNAASGRVPLGE